jgi:cysteine-rich repeat protein
MGSRSLSLVCVLAALALAACKIAEDPARWEECEGSDLVCPIDTECSLDGTRCLLCGDGILNGEEVCDDGNRIDGDKCDTNCTPTGCGNGVVTQGEACDDGNQLNGDRCTADCLRTCPPDGCPS